MKKTFILIAVAFLTNNIFAAIRYTTFSQQVTSSAPTHCDVDNDGDYDFRFTATDIGPTTGSTEFHVIGSKPSSFYAAEGGVGSLPKAYAAASGLGTHQWQNGSGLLASPSNGYFNATTKYLMVKFNDASNTYFGWIAIYKAGWTLQIEGFAYNDVPNMPITPGEMPATGIQDVNPVNFNLAKFTSREIAFQNCTEFDKVGIFALDGKLVGEIKNPVALQNYSIEQANGLLVVAFYREQKLIYSVRHFVQEKD